MRLTLRTLLAYLDDILPAAETKELGEKIAGSPMAAQLVDRIRDVMRRRRLTAPEIDGAGGGIEPNLVAEYLDNSLPPDRVADVERVCLESDVNLAEVAACHQVLTLVLGEPVDIAGRLRERMYALGPQGTPLDVPEPSSSKNVRETNAREQLAAIQGAQKKSKPAPAAKPAGSRVPDYLRTPLWRRVLPWMIVPLLLLAYLALFWNDPTFFPLGKKAVKDQNARVAANEKGDAKRANAVKARQETPAPADEDAATAAVAATDNDLPNLPVDPEPPADESPMPAATNPPNQTEAGAVGEAVAPAKPQDGAPAEPPSAATETPAADAATPADAAPPQIDLQPTDGIVLRFDPRSEQWFPLQADQDPPAGAPVVVPEPFRAELTLADLPLRVLALGGTRLAPLGETAAAAAGFDLAQGRLRISGDTAAANDAAKMMFALRLGQGLWRIEPLTPDTVIGIEALPLQPSGEGQDLSSRTPQGVVYVAAGAARVADAADRVEVASAGNRLILTPSEGAAGAMPPPGEPLAAAPEDAAPSPAEAATPEPAATSETGDGTEPSPEAAPAEAPTSVEPLPPLGLPEWLTPREPTSAAKRAMASFKGEFIPDAPASSSLVPAVRNRNFNIAEPAAKALGLIEDVDGLVKTLRDAEHEEAILAAVDGLRNWLGRSPDNAAVLRDRLEATFAREGMVETLDKLLWGYGPEDAKDTPTAQQLVDWLSHPEPVVRELAFYHIKRLSGRTLNYNPLATQSQRAGAVNQWRAFVARHGGLVVSQE